jgi:hypothetical protein
MFAFLGFLAVVYFGGVAWGFVKTGGAQADWEWPVRLAVLGWAKLFGADSVFDPKEPEDTKDPE